MATEWYPEGLEDDVRPRLLALADAGRPFALATIAAATGGPHPLGSQMAITETASWGSLSDGCIEADVRLQGREVLAGAAPRRLVYGEGSPLIDLRLACGGRLEVEIERVGPNDARLGALRQALAMRRISEWPIGQGPAPRYPPRFRLLVVGADAFALAVAELARGLKWLVTLNAPFGPSEPPPIDCAYTRLPVAGAIAELRPDAWTGVAVLTHDLELDHEAVAAALASEAGYVGVLGAHRRLPERMAKLRGAGLEEIAIARLHAPIGLAISAASPRETAVATLAEIVGVFRGREATGVCRE